MLERLRRTLHELRLALRRHLESVRFEEQSLRDEPYQEGQLMPIRVEASRHQPRYRR